MTLSSFLRDKVKRICMDVLQIISLHTDTGRRIIMMRETLKNCPLEEEIML